MKVLKLLLPLSLSLSPCMWMRVHVYGCAPSSTPHHYFKMLPSQSDRLESDIWVSHSCAHTRACMQSHSWPLTHPHMSIQYNHDSPVFVDLTLSNRGGWRVVLLLNGPFTSAYWTVFACFAILLRCKALWGEINFNQSRFPTALVGALEESALLCSDEQGICSVTLSKETSSWALSCAHSHHLSIGVCRGMHLGRTDAN